MKQIIQNLELIQSQVNKLVEEKGIFVLGNPFLKALLDNTIEDLKSQYDKPQRPFDKLKELWDEWNSWLEVTPLTLHKSFEFWLIETNKNFYDCNFIKEVHLILCNECGFATTAEVRRAIQELKHK